MTKTKAKDALNWLKTACNPKDASRELYHTPHPRDGRTYATDGYRMHVIHDALPIADESKAKADFASLVPSKRENTATISTEHLKQALKACKPFARDSARITRWSLNGSLEIAATSNEWGDVQVTLADGDQWPMRQGKRIKQTTVIYKHAGADMSVGLNYQYVLDALVGMPETVELTVNGPTKPVLISGIVDGVQRQAVIMPMHMGR